MWQLPKCAISQAATFQVCPSRSARPPAYSSRGARPLAHPNAHPNTLALGHHCTLRRLGGPNLSFEKLPLEKFHILEVATWEIDTWEVALGKMPLRKSYITYLCDSIGSYVR